MPAQRCARNRVIAREAKRRRRTGPAGPEECAVLLCPSPRWGGWRSGPSPPPQVRRRPRLSLQRSGSDCPSSRGIGLPGRRPDRCPWHSFEARQRLVLRNEGHLPCTDALRPLRSCLHVWPLVTHSDEKSPAPRDDEINEQSLGLYNEHMTCAEMSQILREILQNSCNLLGI